MKHLIPLIVVLVCIVVAFLWVFLGPAEEDFLDDVQITTTDTAADKSPRRSRDRSRPAQEQPRIVRSARVNLDQPIVFNEPLGLDEANSTVVTVVDALTNESLAGAVVTVVDQGATMTTEGQQLLQTDLLGFFRTFGIHYRTSEDGTLRIPDQVKNGVIAAFTDSVFGRQSLEAPFPLRVELRCSPILKLKARVRTSGGDPVRGIPVRVGVKHATSHFGPALDAVVDLHKSITNAEGIATVTCIGGELYDIQQRLKDAVPMIELDGLLEPRQRKEIDLASPPTGIIEFTLPDVGSIDLRLVHADGTAHTERRRVFIGPAGTKSKAPVDLAGYEAEVVDFAEGGRLFIPIVTCNRNLRITVRDDDDGYVDVSVLEPGPTKPGETKVIEIVIHQSAPVVRARLLGSDRNPLQNTTVLAQTIATTSYPSTWSEKLVTDSQGRVALMLGKKHHPERVCKRRSLTFSRAVTPESPALISQVDLSILPIKEDIDLGDVVLKAPRILAQGRVVDHNGLPIYRAKVTAGLLPRIHRQDNLEISLKKATQAGDLTILATLRTNRNGEFVVEGLGEVGKIRLTVQAEGFRTAWVEVPQGAQDIEVQLEPPASIAGRIVLANGVEAQGLYCNLMTKREDGSEKRIRIFLDEEGAFIKKELKSGRYVFEVCGHKSQKDLLLTRPAQVRPGENLDLGDMRIEFGGTRLVIRLQEPKLVPRGLLIVASEQGGTKELSRFVMTRRAETIYVPVPVCDLHVTTPGYRQTTMRGVSGGTVDLKLEPGIPVAFECTNPEVVPEGYVVEFWVDPKLGTGPFWLKDIGSGRTIPFHSPGTFPMSATLAKVGAYAQQERFRILPRSVKVLDSTSTQRFRLRLEKEEVDKARRRLESR